MSESKCARHWQHESVIGLYVELFMLETHAAPSDPCTPSKDPSKRRFSQICRPKVCRSTQRLPASKILRIQSMGCWLDIHKPKTHRMGNGERWTMDHIMIVIIICSNIGHQLPQRKKQSIFENDCSETMLRSMALELAPTCKAMQRVRVQKHMAQLLTTFRYELIQEFSDRARQLSSQACL